MKSWLVSVSLAVGYMVGGAINVDASSEIVAAWLIKDDSGKQEKLRYSPEIKKYIGESGDNFYRYHFQEKDNGELEIARTEKNVSPSMFSTVFSASPIVCTTDLEDPASLVRKIFIENQQISQKGLSHHLFHETVYKLDQPIESFSGVRIKKRKKADLLIHREGEKCRINYEDDRWTCTVTTSPARDIGKRRFTHSYEIERAMGQIYHYKVEDKQGEAYKGTLDYSIYQPCGSFHFKKDLPLDKDLSFQEGIQLSENTYQDILVLGDEKYVVTWNPDKDMDTLEVCQDNSLPKKWITPRRVAVGSGCALLAGVLYKLHQKEDYGEGVKIGGLRYHFYGYVLGPTLNYFSYLFKNY